MSAVTVSIELLVHPQKHSSRNECPQQLVMAATGAKLSGAALKRHLKARYLDEPLA